MNPELETEILQLRERKLTPKQIARKLGVKQSEVKAFIKASAAQAEQKRLETGDLPPVARCTLDTQTYEHFFGERRNTEDEDEEGPMGIGLGVVFLSRSDRFERYSITTYLVDYWCLGVKDAMKPRPANGSEHSELLSMAYSGFPEGFRDITLEQAQALVFGAAEYAKGLGFDPHPDFEEAKAHLGQWNGELKLEFGLDGEPFFTSGPYDDVDSIMQTLRRNVGDGNFHYTIGVM
ncbi:DNA-binding response regulator [Geitlerinema sp. CS-897]|nr:DNA-binding response regulator [Geitlerinema sp. CS-897]